MMEPAMNKPILAAALALAAWATTDNPLHAWSKSYFSIGLSASREATGGYYVCNRTFGCNPPPCCPNGTCGYGGGPVMFNALAAAPRPYAVAPAAAPGYAAPQQTPAVPPAVKSTAQQVGYVPQTGYGYTGFGYGYGAGYTGAAASTGVPSYWYGD
jgi:hypothetical protein